MFTPIVRIPSCYGHPDNTDTQLLRQPRSQGSLQPALSRSVGRVGENPGNEVAVTYGLFPYLAGRVRLAGHEFWFLLREYSSWLPASWTGCIFGLEDRELLIKMQLSFQIGPLQLAIHMVQNRHAGEQKSHPGQDK